MMSVYDMQNFNLQNQTSDIDSVESSKNRKEHDQGTASKVLKLCIYGNYTVKKFQIVKLKVCKIRGCLEYEVGIGISFSLNPCSASVGMDHDTSDPVDGFYLHLSQVKIYHIL